jgi:hypothetical protein
MADRELIAAIILAGMLAPAPSMSEDDCMGPAIGAADKLIKALAAKAQGPET